jgi:hypothetical protein
MPKVMTGIYDFLPMRREDSPAMLLEARED